MTCWLKGLGPSAQIPQDGSPAMHQPHVSHVVPHGSQVNQDIANRKNPLAWNEEHR